jgi:predicted nucleic acid-binding Zn ribbon protein
MKTCRKCSGDVNKLISNCSFQLKGTGWYVTDYGRKDTTTAENKTSSDKPSDKTSSSDDKKDLKKETGQSQQPDELNKPV